MSIASEITRIKNNIAGAYVEAETKGATMPATENSENLASTIATIPSGGDTPPTTTGGLFTGATIPLTYKDNTHDYENNYEYKSAGYDITITGLTGRATITGNGTKSVLVEFDVTSSTSSLAEFTISLTDGTNTYDYKGLHAHYGTTVTGILTFAYTNIPRSGTGTIGTEYKFIETSSTTLPLFSSTTTLWNTIYSYQVLNTLIGNYSSTSIGTYFLRYCYSFNQPLTIPNGVASIGNHFLGYCYSFNQPLTIPSGVASIGTYFLSNCYSFNQPLTFPSEVTSIGTSFLRTCYSFNQPLTIPSGVSSIGNNFLSQGYSFNQPLTIPSGVTSIGDHFLGYCYSFNQPLTIPNGVTSIEYAFLYQCYSFNQPLTIPNGVASIGTFFLQDCYSFNQPLTIPNGVESIGGAFLYNCFSFNQPLTIPNGVTSIFGNFLYQCYSFNQPLTIPNGVTSIGSGFLYQCYSLSTIIYNADVYPTDDNSLSQTTNSKTDTTNGAGIIVYGTNRAGLMTALPNKTSSPYRKLINGGS